MIIKLARYTIKPAERQQVLVAVQKFVKAVAKHEPSTFYQAFFDKDSNLFYHLMKFSSAQAEDAHQNASYTADFVKVLYPLCEEEPRFVDLSEIAPHA